MWYCYILECSDGTLYTGITTNLEMRIKSHNSGKGAKYTRSGYGGQELFGTIWYEDGTWSDRGEYDGSEWWNYNKCPDIPDDVKRLDKERDQKINKIIE